MNNRISELRIRNNRRRRKRQLRRNVILFTFTILLTFGTSTAFFSLKARAQDSDKQILYKYYRSLPIERGDTLWDIACEYAEEDFYDSIDCYVKEVIRINHLPDETIITGQSLIIPYYAPAS